MQNWREATTDDYALMKRLFTEHAEAEMGALAETGVDVSSLIDMQWRGREMSYAAAYPTAQNLVLLDEHGEAVGRLLAHCGEKRWRLVDVAILADKRGRGLGETALRAWQQQAALAGVEIALQTRPENPARRLYERLGFQALAENELTVEMIWTPALTQHDIRRSVL